jgi:hypothetical protein
VVSYKSDVPSIPYRELDIYLGHTVPSSQIDSPFVEGLGNCDFSLLLAISIDAAMDIGPVAPNFSAAECSADDELMVKDLPLVSYLTLTK